MSGLEEAIGKNARSVALLDTNQNHGLAVKDAMVRVGYS